MSDINNNETDEMDMPLCFLQMTRMPISSCTDTASRETMSPSTRSPTRLSSTMSQTPSTRFWTIWNSIQMTRNNIRTSMRFL